MTALIPILFMVLGALAYALSANARIQELGRCLFLAGAIATAFYYSGHPVHIP